MMRRSFFQYRLLTLALIVLALLAIPAVYGLALTRAEKAAFPDTLQPALSGLASQNAFERANAVKALRLSKDPAVVPVLFQHLDDPDQAVGLYVAQALGELASSEDLSRLRATLADANADVRWRAAVALGEKRDTQAVSALAQALSDSEVLVQRAAADALAKISNPAALSALVAALGSQSPSTVQVSMQALEAAGQQATPILSQALYSSNAQERQNAASLLGYVGGSEALPALQLAAIDQDPAVRSEVAWAISQIEQRN